MSQLLKRATSQITKTTRKEKRVVLVGAKKSGKTTAEGCLSLACELKSQTDPSFSHYIEEKSSGIRQVPSDLCQGFFPEETPSGLIYEAILHVRQKKPLREKNVDIPVCETAGEDMQNLAGPFEDSIYRQSPNWEDADILNKYIFNSNGYIVVLPVSEANIPFVPSEFKDTHDEPQDNFGHFVDPDLVLARIVSAVLAFKKAERTSPRIDGIAVLLSKIDKIMHFVKSQGMDLNTAEGQHRFLTTYFRQTTSVLKYYGLEKVRFFPVFVEVEKTKTPEGKIVISKDAKGKPRIALDKKNNLPLFSKTVYNELIDWILDTFS